MWRIISFIFLLASIQALHGQDIQLSEPDSLSYQLPTEILIQSAAKIGGTTLVVWGSQHKDSTGNGVKNALVMQIARNGRKIGSPQLVHSPNGVPFSMVSTIALMDRFCVFWNDRRAGGKGLYMRIIDTLGNPIGSEVTFGDVTLNTVEAAPELPNSHFILTTSGQYVLRPNGTLDPRRIVVDLWQNRSYSLMKDTSVVIVSADSIVHYRSLFDSSKIATAWVGATRYHIVDCRALIADSQNQFHFFYADMYDTTGWVYNPYLRVFEKGIWRMMNIKHRKYDSALTVLSNDSVVYEFTFNVSPIFNKPDGIYDGLKIVRMCDSDIGIIFQKKFLHKEDFIDDNVENQFWVMSDEKIFQKINDMPQSCEKRLMANRLADDKFSTVRLAADTILFEDPIEPILVVSTRSKPVIHNYNNRLSFSYLNGGMFLLIPWDGENQIGIKKNQPSEVMIPLPTKQKIWGEFLPKPDEYTSIRTILSIQNELIYRIQSYRRDFEIRYSSNGDSFSESHHQGQIQLFISNDSGFTNLSLFRKNDFIPLNIIGHIAYDPNLSEIMHIVPRYTVSGIVRSSNVMYNTTPHQSVDNSSKIIVIGNGAYLVVNGTKVSLINKQGKKIDSNSITPVTGLVAYQRILGDYFIRVSNPDSTTLRIEKFSTNCVPVNSTDLAWSSSLNSPFIAQNPNDSSFVLMYGSTHGVRATILNTNVSVRTSDSLISSFVGATASPNGVFRNDSLYFVYVAIRSQKSSDIFGGRAVIANRTATTDPIEVEEISIPDIHLPSNILANKLENQLSITPNVVTGELKLHFLNHESGPVAISLYSTMGERLYSESFPLVLAGQQMWTWSPSKVSNGLYRLSVETTTGRMDAPVVFSR